MPITGVAGSPWPYNPQAQNTPWSPPWGATPGTPGNPYPWDPTNQNPGGFWQWPQYTPPTAQAAAPGQPQATPGPYTPFTPGQLPVVGGAFPQGTQWPDVTSGQPTVDGRTNAITGQPLDPSQPINRIGPATGGILGTPATAQAQPSSDQTAASTGTSTPVTSATAISDAQKATIEQLKSAGLVKGDPIGSGAPEMQKDPNGILPTSPTGNTIYTFGDGTTAVVGPNGEVGTVTPPAEKSAATLQNQAGVMPVGNQIWVKGSDGVWTQSTGTQATQQLSDAKTQADTAYTDAQTRKMNIDSQIAADPTNQALAQQKTQADIDYQRAQIAKQQADAAYQQGQLAVSQGNLAISQAKAPGEIAQTAATTAGTQATTQETLRRAAEPTVIQTGTTAPNLTVWNPATQQMESQPNTSYLPTDSAHMQIQLNEQQNQYAQQLAQQVQQGKLSPDAATSQYNSWYSQNIEPMKPLIAQTQATEAATLQKSQEANQYQALINQYYPQTEAIAMGNYLQGASDKAQSNFLSMMPYMVNSSAATTPGVTSNGPGKFPTVNPQQIMANATYSVPNLMEIGRQGAAQALQNLSPTAAMHAQMPGPMPTPYPGGMPNFGMPGMPSIGQNPYLMGVPPSMAAAGATNSGNFYPNPTLSGAGPGSLYGSPQLMPQGGPPGSMQGAAGSNLMSTAALNPAAMTSYTIPGLDMSQFPGYTPAM